MHSPTIPRPRWLWVVAVILLMVCLLGLTAEAPQTQEKPAPIVQPVIAQQKQLVDCLPLTDEELDILYRITWAEARGEDDKGMVLVVNVIFNRINAPQFPDCVKSVVFQPGQFCPVRNGQFDRATPCERITHAVHRAVQGEDHSQGALFFRMVQGAAGSWHENALTSLFDHGTHRFYL